MPLTGDFTLNDVSNEFGSATRPSLDHVAFQTAILGTPVAGDDLRDFTGYGRPTLTSITVTNGTGERDVDFTFTLTTNQLASTVVIKRADNAIFSSGVVTVDTLAYSSGSSGVKNESYTMASYSTTYYFRIYVYNAFVSNSIDWIEYPSPTTAYSVTTDAQPTLTAPNIYDVDLIPNGSRYDVRLFFGIGGVIPDSYIGEARIDGGAYFGTIEKNLTSLGSNNYRIDLESANFLLGGGEDIDATLEANKQNYSPATGSVSFVATALNPPSNVSLVAQSDQTVDLTFTRGPLSGATHVKLDWYKNGVFYSTNTITTAASSYTKDFSGFGGDSVYVRASYTEGIDTSYAQSNTVTVQSPSTEVTAFSGTYISFGAVIALTWNDAEYGNPDTDYEIQRSKDFAGFVNLNTNVSATANAYDDVGVVDGTYQYRIRLNNGGVFGDWVTSNTIVASSGGGF